MDDPFNEFYNMHDDLPFNEDDLPFDDDDFYFDDDDEPPFGGPFDKF